MVLQEVPGPPGAPWERAYRGTFLELTVVSELLAGNPLGDPATRPLYVYLPPGYDEGSARRYPTIYLIQGLTGQLDMWRARPPFQPTVVERVDSLFAGDDCPPCVVVFVDAWTSYGGSQFIDSVGTGPYMSYLCDEVVPFVDERFATLTDAGHRGLTGKSSGGYGAMVVPMLRPDVFGALASHAGDALFEACYLPEFRETVRILRDRFEGSFDVFWKHFHETDPVDLGSLGTPMNSYAMAACYSPDEARPGKALPPFDVDTARLIPEVWDRWLEWDPVRIAPQRLDALAAMKRIYLDAGRKDEYYLDLGAQAFARVLADAGIDHTLELFEGKHGGIAYRYPGAIRELALALSPS